jgi:LmbE family N-acetylglucosaminyl deacetylase
MLVQESRLNQEVSKEMSAVEAGENAESNITGKRGSQCPKVASFDFESNVRALVLAPHPDDEVLGCGGTICKFGRKGMHFKIVYMTDGRHGSTSISTDKLVEIRKKEAVNGLRVLGCNDVTFLGKPDRGLKCDDVTIGALKAILSAYEPRLLFLPPFDDFHPDHAATSEAAAIALKDCDHNVDCYFYEVMSTVTPNIVVDITDVMRLKIKAMDKHRSQIEVVDYSKKIKALNSYRSILAGKRVKYCEAYFSCSRTDLVDLARSSGIIV